MSRLSRRLLVVSSLVHSRRTQAALRDISSRLIDDTDFVVEAEGGMIDRAMTLKDLGPLFETWETASKMSPEIPEAPGMVTKALFAMGGVASGSIGKIFLSMLPNLAKARPGIITLLQKKALKDSGGDQAAARQAGEQKWDSLVAPLRTYANYDGVPPKVKAAIDSLVGAAG